MILSDRDIARWNAEGRLTIQPFIRANLQPSSLDLVLAPAIRVFHNHEVAFIDVRAAQDFSQEIVLGDGGSFIVHPGEFFLGTTAEMVGLPNDLAAKIEGRSSLGRLGLVIHATAGYVDPGFSGQLTLEISNISNLPIKLYSGMRIAQISFIRMSSPVEKPYGSPSLASKYQGQAGPTASRISREFNRHENWQSTVRAATGKPAEIIVRESVSPTKELTSLIVEEVPEDGGKARLLELVRPTSAEAAAALASLRDAGLLPDRVVIGVWSGLRSLVQALWPEAQVRIELED